MGRSATKRSAQEERRRLAELTPEGRATLVTEAWVTHLRYLREQQDHARAVPGQGRERPERVWASGWSPCTRELALNMLHPEARIEPDADGMERLQRGREREEAIVARLLAAGKWAEPLPFTVQGGQHAFRIVDTETEDPRRPGEPLVICSGKLEGWLDWADGFRAPFEVKAGRTFQNARTAHDLDAGKWTRSAVPQLLTGLYALQAPLGFVVVDRHGLPGMIPVPMDHERVRLILAQYREATLARLGAQPVPEPIAYTPEVCSRCPHLNGECTPPGFRLAGDLIHDPDVEDALRHCYEHPTAKADYERNWDFARERLHGVEVAQVGPFLVEGSWSKRRLVEVPAKGAIARRYARARRTVEEIEAAHTRVEPRGSYRLRIVGRDE